MIRFVLAALFAAAPGVACAQTILWYHGNGGTVSNASELQSHFTTTLGGTYLAEDDWNAVTPSDHRIILLARPTQAFDAAQIAALDAFVADGGLLVLAGDSISAGQPQIDTLNGVLDGLGLTARLEPVGLTPEGNTCTLTTVINASDFVASSNAPSVTGFGDIDAGSGTILVGFSQTSGSVTTTAEILVEEGGVLIGADYDLFSDDTCGFGPKQSFWTSLFGVACDHDEDGVRAQVCGGSDCDDEDGSVGAFGGYPDADGDGFGDDAGYTECQALDTPVGGDCDDSDGDVNPDASEVCNGVDDDCDGMEDEDLGTPWFPDADGDGFGDDGAEGVVACDAPSGHVDVQGDCDDTRDTVSPDATEVCSNLVDDDCDGTVDEGCQTVIIPPDKPCGCASPAPGGLVLWLGALLAVRRRGCR
ncbi:MAG: hypothetical protein H6737_00465 [Alphaproteobacteria bacterium]|nr:hypothetical protein [Alphaproteobacteria bacterium]